MSKHAVIPRDHLDPLIRLAWRAVRFWRVGLLAFLGVVAAATLVTVLSPKQYRSDAVVFYREGLQWNQNAGVSPRRMGQKLRDMLLARAQLAQVVEELGLYPELVEKGRMGDAVEEMRLATAFRFSESDVFSLSFTGRTPEEAQRVMARLTELLIAQNSQLRSQQAEIAKEFLDAEKKRKVDELSAKEAELMRFLARHPEFAREPSTAVGVTLRSTPRKAPEGTPPKDHSVLGALRREEQRLRRELETPGQVLPVPQDPALVAARNEAEAKLAAARRELADRRARFTEQHPDVRVAVAGLAAAEEAQRAAVEALEASERTVPVRPEVLAERLTQARKDIAEHERRHPRAKSGTVEVAETSEAAKRVVAVETEWARLSREVGEARDHLEQLESQQFMAYMTASVLTSGQAGRIVVVDPASRPVRPVGMSVRKRLLAGVALAILVGVGVALVAALLDDLIHDHLDVERLGLAPVLMEIRGQSLQLQGEAAGGGGRDGPPEGVWAGEARTPEEAPTTSLVEIRQLAGSTPRSVLAAPPGSAGPTEHDADHDLPRASTDPLPPELVAGSAPSPSHDGERTAEEPTMALAPHLARPMKVAAATTTLFSFDGQAFNLVRVQRIPPTRRVDSRITMLSAPESAGAASYRVLRHRVGERKGVKTILVTSPHAGEGKTSTAVNLAVALAESGLARVLLLEANFRSPSIARLLDLQPPTCLTQQFELHRAQPTEPWVVVEAVAPWLHVAAVSPGTETLPMLDGRVFAQCIEDLQAGYDYIVVDSPAVLESADANMIAETADGIVIVLSAGRSYVRTFRKAVDQLGTSKLMGVVLLGT